MRWVGLPCSSCYPGLGFGKVGGAYCAGIGWCEVGVACLLSLARERSEQDSIRGNKWKSDIYIYIYIW